MKKLLLPIATLALLLVIACQKQDTTPAVVTADRPDPSQLDEFIKTKLLAEGKFLWSWASDQQVWTALANSDQVMAVGYRPANEQNVEDRLHLIDLQSNAWKAARAAVWQIILTEERKLNPDLQASDLEVFPNDVLPVIDVKVLNPATVTALRQSPLVRYAEPMAYEPFSTQPHERSGSGCDGNPPESGLVAGTDYTNITPTCKQSWNHSYHKINQAWANSTGANCRVMIIDTGASDDQDNLGSAFNQGSSSGRSVSKISTLPVSGTSGPLEPSDDQCGHGTSMAGACAAPRGTDGASVGVAYNSNLTVVRAAQDVYLDESREVKGVSDAFTLAGNTTSVKIVSMSMGRLTSSSQISDAVIYAHGKGKLIFCAAGTSFWWTAWFVDVIFPANMSQAVAVTGVKDNLTARCSDCHSGSDVDFVVVMEKASNGKNPLTLADSGNAPGMVGGSSVATATTAGIAALVWAKYPSWTRTQVFDRLKTSSNYFPTRNGQFGWGRINAQTATQ